MADGLTLKYLFAGIPFVDDEFDVRVFLTAVACARRHRGGERVDIPLISYLEPRQATAVFDAVLARQTAQPGRQPSPRQLQLAAAAADYVVRCRPAWSSLLQLPIEIRIIDGPIFGFSSASRPQHVFINARAWKSIEELREQLLHETAHLWVYMIEELWPLHEANDARTYQLPSGVGGKTASAVLNAAF